jgi:AhpD family alkylhydroperoxidase
MSNPHDGARVAESVAYHRRTFSWVAFCVALAGLLWRLPRVLAVHLSGQRIRAQWREALWLAVTEVNGCRFCAYVHEGLAGAAGLSRADIRLLLDAGDTRQLAGLSAREALAVAYAKAWAETSGAPPAGLAAQLAAELTAREVADLHALLRTVHFANRAGNTADSLLHRLRHPRQLLALRGTLNDLAVGIPVALFGWPALVVGAIQRRRPRSPG